MEELFSKKLPVIIRVPDHDDRRVSITITMSVNHPKRSASDKEYIMRLTDDQDAFFLFNLSLSERDFEAVRAAQSLNVDFDGFPKMVIHYLDRFLDDDNRDSSKTQLYLVSTGPSLACAANFNISKRKQFAEYIYLTLRFFPGTDNDIKCYLAERLRMYKTRLETLQYRSEHTESDLNTQLQRTKEQLAAKTEEFEILKMDWLAKISEINNNHARELNLEKERALKMQTSLQEKFEREKHELEQGHKRSTVLLDARCQAAEEGKKEMTENRYKAESELKDLTSRLSMFERENDQLRKTVESLQSENSGFQTGSGEKERCLAELRTKVAVFERELFSKEELCKKQAELYKTSENLQAQLRAELDVMKQSVAKEKAIRRRLSSEVQKGNDIIKKFQTENQELRGKLKLRNEVTVKQEKMLASKEEDLQKMLQNEENLKKAVRTLEDENKKLNESLESALKKVEESKEMIKRSEGIIAFMHKKITDEDLLRSTPAMFESGSNDPSGHFRMSNMAKALGSSVQSNDSASPHGWSTNRPAQAQYQVNARSNVPVPATFNKGGFSNNTAPDERSGLRTMSSVSNVPKSQDAFLDPKYLQQGDVPTRQPTKISYPSSVHGSSGQHSVQPRKDFTTSSSIVPDASKQDNARYNERPKQVQPALMSAYFPSKPS